MFRLTPLPPTPSMNDAQSLTSQWICFRVLEDLVRILIELLCGLAAEAKERVLRQFVPRDVRDDANPCFQSFARSVEANEAQGTGKGKKVGKRDAEAEEFATK